MSTSRVKALLKDLERIKEQCLGEGDSGKKPKQVANEFFGIKEAIIIKVDEVYKNIKERNESLEKYGRNAVSIRMTSAIGKDIDLLKEMTLKLQHKLDKDRNRYLNKLEEKEANIRQQVVDDIMEMVREIDTYNSTRGKTMNLASVRIASNAKKEMDEKSKKLEASRSDASTKKLKGKNKVKDDEIEMGAPVSAEDQMFFNDVLVKDELIDGKLTLLLQNLQILHRLAEEIHQEIDIQGNMINDIETGVDKLNKKFQVANSKMKLLLEESGGASRWCPIIIFIIVLLALVGYIITTMS